MDLLETFQPLPDATDDLMSSGASCSPELAEVHRMVEERRTTPQWKEIDRFEQIAAELPQQRCPLKFLTTPGMLTRVIFMAAGTRLTSKIHLFEHPFVIASGAADVWTLETGWVRLRA